MKYTPCEHTQDTCDSCALKQAESRIELLEGLLCKVHDDCQHNEHLAFACGDREPPRVGDLVWWPDSSIVERVESTNAGLVSTRWSTVDKYRTRSVVGCLVLKRAEPKP